MLKWQSEGDRHQGKAELLAHIINLTACCSVPKELLSHPQYKRLSDLLNRVYYKLCSHQRHKVSKRDKKRKPTTILVACSLSAFRIDLYSSLCQDRCMSLITGLHAFFLEKCQSTTNKLILGTWPLKFGKCSTQPIYTMNEILKFIHFSLYENKRPSDW